MQIGTRMPDRAEAEAGVASLGAVPGLLPGAPHGQGADGTLLAVVPIPGTGTSLAIVGYPVPARPGSEVAGETAGSGVSPSAAAVIAVGRFAGPGIGLVLDYDQRRVWADGAEVSLTFQEFELLAYLAAHPATVYSRADLLREVWQRDFAADSRTVDVHVSRLRHKLGALYGRCLVTEYRAGYQFRPLPLRFPPTPTPLGAMILALWHTRPECSGLVRHKGITVLALSATRPIDVFARATRPDFSVPVCHKAQTLSVPVCHKAQTHSVPVCHKAHA